MFWNHFRILEMKNIWMKIEKIMNEKMSKRRIQITDLQKQESEERRLMHLVPAHFHWQMLTVSQSSITFLHYNPAFLFSGNTI